MRLTWKVEKRPAITSNKNTNVYSQKRWRQPHTHIHPARHTTRITTRSTRASGREAIGKKNYQFVFDAKRATGTEREECENGNERNGIKWHWERPRGTGGHETGKRSHANAMRKDMINIQPFSECNLIFNHFSSFRIFSFSFIRRKKCVFFVWIFLRFFIHVLRCAWYLFVPPDRFQRRQRVRNSLSI